MFPTTTALWSIPILLLIPIIAFFASGFERKAWLTFFIITGTASGAIYGHIMEGGEGAVWGSLIGIVSGFILGWYTLWFLRKIPDRWGLIAGWSLLGIAFTLIPLLLAIRLFAGKIDDDESAIIILAIFYGVFHPFRKEWWPLPFNRANVLKALKGWLRFWFSPRIGPWVAAFLICGLTTGAMGPSFESIQGSSLTVRLLPRSWVWPCGLILAAIVSIIACRSRGKSLLRFFSIIVILLCSIHMISLARHRAEISPDRLHLRFGLWKSIALPRAELASIDTGVIRGRRILSSYPILVTRSGKRHSLRGLPLDHLVRTWLEKEWNVPSNR